MFISAFIIMVVLVVVYSIYDKKKTELIEKVNLEKKRDYDYLTNALIENNYHPTFLVNEDGKVILANQVTIDNFDNLCVNKVLGDEYKFIMDFIESDFFNVQKERKIQGSNYLINITKIKTDKSKRALVSFVDITNVKEVQEKQAILIQNISHEFKTPISAIQGICELLLDGKVIDEQKKNDFVSIIDRENKRLKSIVTRLNKTGLSQPRYDYFSVDDLFKEIDLFFEHYQNSKENITLVVENNIDQIIRQDVNIIMQIIINLVTNAYKYTDEGIIKLSAFLEEGYIIIKVSDTGIGIAQEDLDKIFMRFYRADNSFSNEVEGSGLGLSLVKELIMSIGGSIEVSSKLHQGTEFTLSIKNID